MRPAVAAAVSLGGFVATLALLLLTPLGEDLVVSAVVLVGLVVALVLTALRRIRAVAIPWLAVPPLSASRCGPSARRTSMSPPPPPP